MNAGHELGRIDGTPGLLSPRLWFAYLLVRPLPLAARRVLAAWWRQRVGR